VCDPPSADRRKQSRVSVTAAWHITISSAYINVENKRGGFTTFISSDFFRPNNKQIRLWRKVIGYRAKVKSYLLATPFTRLRVYGLMGYIFFDR
jgi:hypothetical protein